MSLLLPFMIVLVNNTIAVRYIMRFKQRRGQKNIKQTREVNIETVPPSLTLKTLR